MKDRQAPENGNMALHVCQDPVAVLENRRILAGQTLPLDHWALPWQKHTANSHRVTAAERGRGAADKDTGIMDVDAVWTTEPDTLIGVFTADCVGMLVADPGIPLVACIHSGWKGTAQAITLKTMRELISVGGLDPARAQAWFSPSILQDSLEVGPEVIEAMEPLKELGLDVDAFWRRSEDPDSDRLYLDNQGLNVAMLRMAGLPAKNIHVSDLDTKTHPDCFSYRNEGRKTGEHFTFGWIESSNPGTGAS